MLPKQPCAATDAGGSPERRSPVLPRRRLLAASLAGTVLAPSALAAPAVVARWRIGVDALLVEKSRRQMTLLQSGAPVMRMRVAVGRASGAKLHEGDGRTPEGRYRIDGMKPDSVFHRSLRISYPNDADRERASGLGLRPGGLIMIHGLDRNIEAAWQADHWMFNWTRGCIAVTNAEMDLLWDSVALGTPIDIVA